jgi:hypothetical protein
MEREIRVSLARLSRGQYLPIPMALYEGTHEVLNSNRIYFSVQNNSDRAFAILLNKYVMFRHNHRKAVIISPRTTTQVPVSFRRRDRAFVLTVQRIGDEGVGYFWKYRVRLVSRLDDGPRSAIFTEQNCITHNGCPGPY